MNKLYDIDDLIAKVLADEATLDEARELQERLAGSAELRQYFEQMRRLWDASETAIADLDVNTDAAWDKVQTRIHAPKTVAKPLTISWLRPRQLLRLAAIGLILVAASVWFFQKNGKNDPLSIEAQNVAIEQKMEDGSEVKVSEKSKLTAVFSKKERRVKLEGEATFKVAPDTEKPFFVEVKTLEVKVVGTQFTVDDRSQAGKVIVTVFEGIVMIKGGDEEQRLTKDMRGEYDLATQHIAVSYLQPTQEMKPNLDFRGQTLKEIASALSIYHNKTIEVDAQIAHCKRTINLSETDIKKVLGQFEAMGYEVIETEKGYKITGNECQE